MLFYYLLKMEGTIDSINSNSEAEYASEYDRDVAIFISQINDHVYNHTDQISEVLEHLTREENKVELIQHTQSFNNITDISKITQGKSPEEIAILALKWLSTNIAANDLLKNQSSEDEANVEEFFTIIYEEDIDDPFKFKCRKRYRKLSESQIRFF